jgi:hypothetical protein
MNKMSFCYILFVFTIAQRNSTLIIEYQISQPERLLAFGQIRTKGGKYGRIRKEARHLPLAVR